MALPRFPALSAALLTLALAGPVALAAEDAAQSTRAYVETSYLIAPHQVGEFKLIQTSYDPDNKYSGPGFRYQSQVHPEIRVDVYVYPAGRMEQAYALDTGMQGFHADLARAVDAGVYSDLVVEEAAFALADKAQADALETGGDSDDPFAALLLAAEQEESHPEGRKLSMTLLAQPGGQAMHSAGYLAYRQLYFFKLRASVLQDTIEAAPFHVFADRAARTLLPVIEAAHVGDCANSTLTINPDASAEDMAIALVKHSTRQLGYNCHLDAEGAGIAAKSAQADVIDIHYEPQEWSAQ